MFNKMRSKALTDFGFDFRTRQEGARKSQRLALLARLEPTHDLRALVHIFNRLERTTQMWIRIKDTHKIRK